MEPKNYFGITVLYLTMFFIFFFILTNKEIVEYLRAHHYGGLFLGMIAVTIPFWKPFRGFCESLIEESEEIFRSIAKKIANF